MNRRIAPAVVAASLIAVGCSSNEASNPVPDSVQPEYVGPSAMTKINVVQVVACGGAMLELTPEANDDFLSLISEQVMEYSTASGSVNTRDSHIRSYSLIAWALNPDQHAGFDGSPIESVDPGHCHIVDSQTVQDDEDVYALLQEANDQIPGTIKREVIIHETPLDDNVVILLLKD